MFLAEFAQNVQRAIPVFARLVRVDGGGCYQFASGIDHRHFHARADAGVQAHHHARAGGCGEKQVAQIVGKHLDGDFFSVFTQAGEQIALG